MSANTSFATTTSTLTQFIAKQKLTNGAISSDLSSTEYPITPNYPLVISRDNGLKTSTMYMVASSASSDGYLFASNWTTFNNKLTSITAGTNISSTSGTSPTVSLSISNNLDMSNNIIKNLSSQDYKTEIDIKQANTSRIYTSGGLMNINPLRNLTILSDVSLNGKIIDMVSGVITGISNESFITNIDIRQGATKRIFTTTGANPSMTLNSAGNLKITSDVSLNGQTLDMGGGIIKHVSEQDFETIIDIKEAGTSRISTSGGIMTIAPGNNLTILTDVSLNGKMLDMVNGDISGISSTNFNTNIDIKQAGTSRISTSGGIMTIAPGNELNITSDVVTLNGILPSDTGNVLTFDTANNHVGYYPFYDFSSNVMNLNVASIDSSTFNMSINKVFNNITLTVEDITFAFGTGTKVINIIPAIDASYCPSSDIYLPAIVYNDNVISNTCGKLKITTSGLMYLYNTFDGVLANWISSTAPIKKCGMVSQCFTYSIL